MLARTSSMVSSDLRGSREHEAKWRSSSGRCRRAGSFRGRVRIVVPKRFGLLFAAPDYTG
jgi:hypothetical protein